MVATLLEYVGSVHIYLGPYRGNPIALYLRRTEAGCQIGPRAYPWNDVVGAGKPPTRPPQISKKSGRAKDWLLICIQVLRGKGDQARTACPAETRCSSQACCCSGRSHNRPSCCWSHECSAGSFCACLKTGRSGSCPCCGGTEGGTGRPDRSLVLIPRFHQSVQRPAESHAAHWSFHGRTPGESAMANPIHGIDQNADDGPHKESDPGHPGEEIH